jgi:hypothetical protein
MKFGSFMFQPQKPEGFDFHVLRVKPETGFRIPTQPDMHSNIAVFADTLTVQNHPDWVSQSPLGPAKFGNNNFNIYWSVVCPTQPEYREEQLKYISEVDRQSLGVWLNSQYFADHDHCNCPRCKERHAKSGLGWLEWRRKEIDDYMSQIRDVVKKELVFCLQPDPVSSYERYGVDFDDFTKLADYFCVVMFSKNYATPWYWEMLSRAFKKLLKKPFYVNLYVFGPGDNPKDAPTPDELLTVTVRCARAGVDGFLYTADGANQMMDFQKQAVANTQLRERLKSYGGKPVQEALERFASWEKTIR